MNIIYDNFGRIAMVDFTDKELDTPNFASSVAEKVIVEQTKQYEIYQKEYTVRLSNWNNAYNNALQLSCQMQSINNK